MSIDREMLESAIIILSRAEIFHDSVKNELYKFFHNFANKEIKKGAYHLVMEISRKKNILDEYIANTSHSDADDMDIFIRNALRTTTYIIKEEYYSSGIPPTFENISKILREIIAEKQSPVITNNILDRLKSIRTINRNSLFQNKGKTEYLALKYYHPTWFVEYMSKRIGEENAIHLMSSNNEVKQIWLRINFLKPDIDIKYIIKDLAEEGVKVKLDKDFFDVLKVLKVKRAPVTTGMHRMKYIIAQDKTSSAISHLLNPKPNDIVIDLACAPGMKLSHILALMKQKGRVIGIDVSIYRLKKLILLLSQLSNEIKNLDLICADSRYVPLKKEIANKILLDAPCSSSGIYRSYPDHKWRDTSIFDYFSQIQSDLLKKNLNILKKEGIGIYSVCSIHHLEGEEIIKRNINNISILPINYGSEPYLDVIQDKEIFTEIIKCKRTFPFKENTNSFFICKIKRK